MQCFSYATKLALVGSETQDLLVVSFRPEAVLDQEGMAECLTTCNSIASMPVRHLWVIPQDAFFCLSLMKQDLFSSSAPAALPSALAVVSSNRLLNQLLGISFAYHPQKFPVAFFHSHVAAIAWLDPVNLAPAPQF